MTQTVINNATINNVNVAEEEIAMVERVNATLKAIEEINKTSEDGYVTNAAIISLLAENNIVCGKRTKRADLVKELKALTVATKYKEEGDTVENLERKPEEEPIVVPVGDMSYDRIYHDDTIIEKQTNVTATVVNVSVDDPKTKTEKMKNYIKEVAELNKKNGYGYTISDFMLRAVILKADSGLERLKGHDVTPEEQDTINRCYAWLKRAGIVKPVVYTVAEDNNVRVYMPDYDGKTDSKKTRMIPYNKSAGYNAIGVTSFKVTLN